MYVSRMVCTVSYNSSVQGYIVTLDSSQRSNIPHLNTPTDVHIYTVPHTHFLPVRKWQFGHTRLKQSKCNKCPFVHIHPQTSKDMPSHTLGHIPAQWRSLPVILPQLWPLRNAELPIGRRACQLLCVSERERECVRVNRCKAFYIFWFDQKTAEWDQSLRVLQC